MKKGNTVVIKDKHELFKGSEAKKDVKSKEEVNSIVNRLYNSRQNKVVDPNVLNN